MTAKLRVYQLARELGISSRDLQEKLAELGIKASTASSGLAEEAVEKVRQLYFNPPEETPVQEAPPEEKPTPPPEEKVEEKKEEREEVEAPPVRPKLKIDQSITVARLSEKLHTKPAELIKKLISLGIMATINQRLETDVATIIADEYGYDAEVVPLYAEELENTEDIIPERMKARAPVVTVMGHVDHGKTSLLDAIRESRITARESGGITQHIGAYNVAVKDKSITFLDTPGHEAFTAMRARGAKVTDIVVLVVAADDGVMPQTVEAIDHARAAGVPIIVAVNKIDKPNANPEQVKQQLSKYNLVPESWGGQTIFVDVSAKQKTGLDNLLEMILLQAELLELKADYNSRARGVVIESRLDRRKGSVATVLIQHGTLHSGKPFICGLTGGKARALHDEFGRTVKQAGPADPVEIMGFADVPQVGDVFREVESERQAREVAQTRLRIKQDEERRLRRHISLETIKLSGTKDLPLIIKADVSGSVEAVRDSLERLSSEEIKVRIIHSGAGGINESDVMLAAASNAVIIGFNVRPEEGAYRLAEKEEVEIRSYRVIYELVDEIKSALEGMLEPEFKEKVLGHLTVLKVFKISKVGTIAGCMVKDGKVLRSARVRLLRDNVIVFDGKLSSLKRFKDDVREVNAGLECGLSLEGFNDIKENDSIEVYATERVKRKLEI